MVRFAVLQFMGAYALWAIFRMEANTSLTTGDRLLVWFSVAGLLAIWAVLMTALVARLLQPAYFIVLEDGSAQWTPWFRARALKFSPAARFTVERNFLVSTADDEPPSGELFKIPISRNFEVMRPPVPSSA
ncbi:hypothetical protein SH584_08660 [Sphingomonas sp. LY29]|uniref:hypothetical protein n=1 Tax=Sphingomonas sp. LY29 TaxID=3095341 RepID=UPI002D7829E5|nr:hypothetical protein [Sphingomonas sp. LY29]WRP25120.1 hypothetical protein SH584_08660 [Sphingomonas sp. LY29]